MEKLFKIVYEHSGKHKVVYPSEREQLEFYQALRNGNVNIVEVKTLLFSRDLSYREAREVHKLMKGLT